MKKLFLLLVLPIVAYSQASVDANTFRLDNRTPIVNRTYTTATVDTTEWLFNLQYKKLWFNAQTKDSAKLVFSYQRGFDTTYFGVKTAFDSLITTSNTGDVKSVDVSSYIAGMPFIRFIVTVSTGAAGTGVSTPTYTVGYKREK